MKWWNSVIDWLSSNEGSRVVTDAILPFLAIVVAGVLAALIARSMAVRVLELHESESKTAAVASLISVARKATAWHTLGAEEKAHSEHLADEASVRLRLLPVGGAGLAAAWAEHEIAVIKENASTFSFQAEQSFNDLRDRLVEWQAKPVRARKLFRSDLERWRVEDEGSAKRSAVDTDTETASFGGSAEPSPARAAAAPVVPASSWAAPVVEPAVASAGAPVAIPAATAAPDQATAPADAAPTAGPVAVPAEATPAVAVVAPAEAPVAAAPAETRAASVEAPSGSETAPTHKPTGMVSTPVVQPPHAVAPVSPSAPADLESGDDSDREPAFSAPVSAHQVRRRTSPESDAS